MYRLLVRFTILEILSKLKHQQRRNCHELFDLDLHDLVSTYFRTLEAHSLRPTHKYTP
jgi:hypothetical protein